MLALPLDTISFINIKSYFYLTFILLYENRQMKITKLSTKGQIIIPKSIRIAHRWKAGQELAVFDSEDGVFLKAKKPFKETTVNEVAGSLAYKAKPKSLKDMEAGIRKATRDSWRDRG